MNFEKVESMQADCAKQIQMVDSLVTVGSVFSFSNEIFYAAMPSTRCLSLSNAMQAGTAQPLHDVQPPENERKSRLELVGSIECPGHNHLQSMSWSPDGKHLATVTKENFSVWRLPGKSRLKSQRLGNNDVDAVYSMPENDMMTIQSKVGKNNEGRKDTIQRSRKRGFSLLRFTPLFHLDGRQTPDRRPCPRFQYCPAKAPPPRRCPVANRKHAVSLQNGHRVGSRGKRALAGLR